MEALDNWMSNTLGEWTVAYPSLYLLIAAGLALILLIMIIVVSVRHVQLKHKIQRLESQAGAQEPVDKDALRAEIRKELEPQIRDELASEYASAAPSDSDNDAAKQQIYEMSRTIDDLNNELAACKAYITELESAEQPAPAAGPDTAELEAKLRDRENEINLLKAENSQIKAQALQQQLAAAQAQRNVETTAAADSTDDGPDEEDEYDEYYDDYGDENSAVKVTLKFDRVKNNWVILRSDSERTYRRLATKQDALFVAKDLAHRLHAQLVVHKKDGRFQKI